MPATVQWDETHPGTISITYTGNWTWNEFYTANKDAKHLMETILGANIFRDFMAGITDIIGGR